MSSLAQEESRSISENVTWGQRKRFQDGKVSMSFGNFLGYRRGENGTPEVVPKEAEIVRRIYKMFLEGKTYGDIARALMADGILTPRKNTVWTKSTIKSILTNEKYKGDALLQKKFTVNFLTKKTKINEGEVPQYYVENSHPAIISSDAYDLAQMEIQKRSEKSRTSGSRHCFTSKLRCECCGGYFGSKVWHSTDQYRKVLWQCNHKFKNDAKCTTPHIYESDLIRIGLEVENQLITNSPAIILTCEKLLDSLFSDNSLDQKKLITEDTYKNAHTALADFVEDNKWQLSDQALYQKRFAELETVLNQTKVEFDNAEAAVQNRSSRKHLIDQFMKVLSEKHGLLCCFDEDLWSVTVDEVLVKQSGELVFMLKSGQQIYRRLRSEL